MFRAAFLFFFVFSASIVSSQGIDFFKGSWEEVIAKAQEENKEIFVDIYTTWCGPCKQLNKTTFIDPELGDYINQHFIPVKVEAEHGINRHLAYAFKIGGYPVMIFLDKNGVQKIQARGYKRAQPLLGLAKYAKHQMKVDDRITNLVTSSVGDLSKEDLLELVNSYDEFHSDIKGQALARLHNLLTDEEKEEMKYVYLSHYPFLSEGLQSYYIDMYTNPSLFNQNRDEIIVMRHNVGKEIEFQYTLAFSAKDKEAFKRALDRRMDFAVKTGQVDLDEREILEGGYIEEYDYKHAGGQF